MSRARRDVRQGATAALLAATVVAGVVVAGPARATAARRAAPWRPSVVETGRVALAGYDGKGVAGPLSVSVRLPRVTHRGDLLVAAVVDGVDASGEPQPRWRSPGWRVAVSAIGGLEATGGGPATGGLEVTILYRPANPGGVRSVPLGAIPSGTIAFVTAVVAEIAGAPARVAVETTGAGTDGPAATDFSNQTAVRTRRRPTGGPALVLGAFTNGGTIGGAYQPERLSWTPGWRLIGEDPGLGGVDQVLVFDWRLWRRGGPPAQTVRFGGVPPIDSCGALAVLG